MRVNQPDGTVRDEVVIVGGSGQAVGMNGDRLKVDANLNVDEVTVSNVGITSVDGAGMEQAGEYMPVKGEVQLTGSNVQVAQGIYDQTLSVAAGASSVVTVTPPTGEKWRITQLYARITQPSGASSGTHRLRVVPSSTIDSRYSVLYLVSNYNQVLEISNNAIFFAQEKRPANEDAQNLAIRSIVVTNANPLHFMYDNQTNAPQTETLEIRIRREVEKLV